jgi:hypothetical protein
MALGTDLANESGETTSATGIIERGVKRVHFAALELRHFEPA